jgi:tRNA-2-methylthio-N6-dimethylallyladenosine synthase
MPNYYIWTIGCQMNKAESSKIAGYLKRLGYQATDTLHKADMIVLNTCVVRQSAETKVEGMLGYLKGMKNQRPELSIIVTGCFVDSDARALKSFPYVDLFFKPSDYPALLNWADGYTPRSTREICPVPAKAEIEVVAYVPIIQGCNNFCSYCIVPYRRGREKSLPPDEVICEVAKLVGIGVKEVTLLGQNVNSYGQDLSVKASLSDLLVALNEINGLHRIRFLTNHPKDMSRKLIKTIASLDKVCRHINLPLQSGDDGILAAMRRGYTSANYRQLVDNIRQDISGVAMSTDVIVGFPNESHKQFEETVGMLEEIKFDTVHVATYSPRSGTSASREHEDNVPAKIKKERLNRIEEVQTNIAANINAALTGKTLEVLVEGKKDGKWFGRTRSNKLVFFDSADNCLGRLVDVTIVKTSAWSLRAKSPQLDNN